MLGGTSGSGLTWVAPKNQEMLHSIASSLRGVTCAGAGAFVRLAHGCVRKLPRSEHQGPCQTHKGTIFLNCFLRSCCHVTRMTREQETFSPPQAGRLRLFRPNALPDTQSNPPHWNCARCRPTDLRDGCVQHDALEIILNIPYRTNNHPVPFHRMMKFINVTK